MAKFAHFGAEEATRTHCGVRNDAVSEFRRFKIATFCGNRVSEFQKRRQSTFLMLFYTCGLPFGRPKSQWPVELNLDDYSIYLLGAPVR